MCLQYLCINASTEECVSSTSISTFKHILINILLKFFAVTDSLLIPATNEYLIVKSVVFRHYKILPIMKLLIFVWNFVYMYEWCMCSVCGGGSRESVCLSKCKGEKVWGILVYYSLLYSFGLFLHQVRFFSSFGSQKVIVNLPLSCKV